MQPFWSRHADLVLRVGQDASYLADVSAARQNARELAAETLDIVVEARLWPAGQDVVDRFLRDAKIDIVSVDARLAARAMSGWRPYGKGRHPPA